MRTSVAASVAADNLHFYDIAQERTEEGIMADVKTPSPTDCRDAATSDIPRCEEKGVSTSTHAAQAPWSNLKAAIARGFSEDFMIDGRDQPLTPQYANPT